jgi:hypothetical protein
VHYLLLPPEINTYIAKNIYKIHQVTSYLIFFNPEMVNPPSPIRGTPIVWKQELQVDYTNSCIAIIARLVSTWAQLLIIGQFSGGVKAGRNSLLIRKAYFYDRNGGGILRNFHPYYCNLPENIWTACPYLVLIALCQCSTWPAC